MIHRRSPTRHRVKQHLRKKRLVHSYMRGCGYKKPTKLMDEKIGKNVIPGLKSLPKVGIITPQEKELVVSIYRKYPLSNIYKINHLAIRKRYPIVKDLLPGIEQISFLQKLLGKEKLKEFSKIWFRLSNETYTMMYDEDPGVHKEYLKSKSYWDGRSLRVDKEFLLRRKKESDIWFWKNIIHEATHFKQGNIRNKVFEAESRGVKYWNRDFEIEAVRNEKKFLRGIGTSEKDIKTLYTISHKFLPKTALEKLHRL